jgi:hypothetical protein
MAITEANRHRLYQRLEVVLGPEEATTMMEHLPPVGWADVATKRDLEHLDALWQARFEAHAASTTQQLDHHASATAARLDSLETKVRQELKIGLGGLRVEVAREIRHSIFAVLAANTAMAGLVFAAARIT